MRPDRSRSPSQIPVTNSPHTENQRDTEQAQRDLYAAIEHASEHDLMRLLQTALASGASLSERDHHGRDVFTIAIRHNRPHAINALRALHAETPDVLIDGIDLLMYAAAWNYDDCCDKLIWHLDMDLGATDAEGCTALFHAVLNGSAEAAQVLLEHGADPDATTTNLSDLTLRKYFDAETPFSGCQITPLMVAAQRCDRVMMLKLIVHGADPDKGDFPPLHIAASQGDAAMIAFLIEQGATIADSRDKSARTALFTAITRDAPLSCLRLLAADYPFFSENLRDPDQVLAEAARRARTDAIALFLGHGALPGTHRAHDPASVWQIVVDAPTGHRADTIAVLDLLASTCAARWNDSAIDTDNAMLAFDGIVRHKDDLASLASFGLYPSLLEGLHLQVGAMPWENEWQPTAPSALRAAWLYLERLHQSPEPVAVATNRASRSQDPGRQWQSTTETARADQSAWLKQAASFLVSSNQKAMQYTLALDFFQQMTASCSDDTRLDTHIFTKLKESTCLPEPMIRLIARAWYEAARDASEWLGADGSLAKAEQLALQRALLKITTGADLILAENQNPATKAWVTGLQQAAIAGLALRDFCADPVRWLMRKEQRNQLRPVDTDELTGALCSELGLPPDTSDGIAIAWGDIIRQLATGVRGEGPHDWWRVAAKLLSQQLADMLVLNAAIALPKAMRARFEHWCVQQTGPLRGRVSEPGRVNITRDMTLTQARATVPINQAQRNLNEHHERPPVEDEPMKKKLRQ